MLGMPVGADGPRLSAPTGIPNTQRAAGAQKQLDMALAREALAVQMVRCPLATEKPASLFLSPVY
jgi:hypothetical protein